MRSACARASRSLKIIVRAHSRTDAYEYVELGVPAVRETFGSALDAAELALRALGYGPRRGAARGARSSGATTSELLRADGAAPHDEVKQLIALQPAGAARPRAAAPSARARLTSAMPARDEQRGEREVRAERL